MAAPFQEDSAQQHSLRIGDTVLLYAKERTGYVSSEVSSTKHNSLFVYKVDSITDTHFPNVHFATFKVVAANKYKAQVVLNSVKKRIGTHEPDTFEKGELLKSEKALQSELKENQSEQERLQGSDIYYGEKIQLLHMLSKKYLYVNTTKTSRTENTSLRVELTDENREECVFKILPRYKVRSVGDQVRYNDQVKFESIKTEGQFLHCSVKTFGTDFKVLEFRHEVNLSATESSLTLIPHYRPMPDHKPKALRAGGTVRLFHRERECYISAEGSFAEGPPVIENVHGRKRHSDHGKLKKPSTSANVYWQFEKESDSRSGEPLSWGERCRIKHLPTRCYLAVVQDSTSGKYSVTLKEQLQFDPQYGTYDDLDTIFSLSPVIQEGDSIETESYARIKHLQTRTWLHLEKTEVYKREAFNPNAPGLDGLQWDSAELYKLNASTTMNYDDAFTLEEVSEDLLDKFNYVAGIVPILTTHVQTYGVKDSPTLTSKEAYLVKSALDDLSEFMSTPHERENKNRQKLLRNLRVLELIIKVLEPFQPDAKDKTEQRVVCQACYGVINSYLDGDSRKNENYLARFVGFFKTQVQMDLNAEEVMIQMVEDNAAIVAKMAETEIDYVVQKLVETMDSRFMEFLGNLCVCAGRPIPATQKTILKKLVEEQGKKVFYRTELGGSRRCPNGSRGVVYFKIPNAKTKDWKPLTNIARKGDDEVSSQCEFLQRQLELFAKLCQGNNATTIRALVEKLGLVSFEEILACASNDDLHPRLRSKYVELMIVMFVDVGENRAVLDNLTLSFVYQKVVENPYESTGGDEGETVALTGVENIHFPAMKQWIYSHLKQTADLGVVASHEHVNDNVLLANVIGVLELLVKYGYYDDPEDMNDVLNPLIKVLNGFSDMPFVPSKKHLTDKQRKLQELQLTEFSKKGGRYEETELNKPVFVIKKKAIEVIDLFLNFRFYVRLQRFIYDFRLLNGDVDFGGKMDQQRRMDRIIGMSGRSPNLPRSLPPTGEVRPPGSLLALQYSSQADIIDSPVAVQMVRERLQYIFSLSAYTFENPDFIDHPFPEILLDVANYKDNELIQNSLYLLSRYFSSENTLFQKAIQTQLLVTGKSEQVFEEVEKLLPVLRRYLSVDVKAKERDEIVQILSRFSEMCSLEGSPDEPHPQNQKILYNYGILTDVLNYVLQRGKTLSAAKPATPSPVETSDEPQVKPAKSSTLDKKTKKKTKRKRADSQMADIEHMFVECYKFLKALAKNHPIVQRRLYDRMDDLLEVEIAVPNMAEMLAEVFTGGLELCLKVKEEQIERLFQLISRPDQDGVPELVSTLLAIAKVEELDKPLKRNQELIVKFFSKTRDKFCDHVLGRQKEKRWELLTLADDENSDLRLLLAMTDLLATCAEGENLFIESVCQTILTVQELLEILNSHSLLPERKRPFARFLVNVYMNTAEDKYSTGAAELTDTSIVWQYLEHLSVYLKNLGQVLTTVAPSESQQVREGLLRARSTTIARFAATGMKARGPLKKGTSESRKTSAGSDGQLLPGALFYFSSGVLPFLAVYYDQFFQLPTQQEERKKRVSVTGHILSALLELGDVVADCFTLDSQVKLYRTTVLTMLKAGDGKIPLSVGNEVLKNFEAKTKSGGANVAPATAAYREEYKEEIELNEAFNKFVANYQHAFEGQNKASSQVAGAKYTTPTVYSEGDECLPLGPSFQNLVALFINPSVSSHRDHRELVKPHLERLLTQLEISFNSQLEDLDETERRRQDALDITCLQIIRAIIHNEVMRIDPQLKEDNPVGYRKRCVSKIHPLQNAIQDFGNAVARVVPLLSHSNGDIVREVLAFMKAMLYSGNRKVQEGMEYLLETREEILFTTMRSLLQQAAATFTEKNVLMAQVRERKAAEKTLFGDSNDILSKATGTEFSSLAGPSRGSRSIESAPFKKQPLKKLGDDPVFLDLESIDEDSFTQRDDVALIERRGRGRKGERFSPSFSEDASLPQRGRKKAVHFELKPLEKSTPEVKSPALVSAAQTDEFEDVHHIKLALQVLGLMCDGQFRVMQNYLREQKDNIISVNVVGEVSLFIQNFYLDINTQTMELIHLILQTLIEMCVGNYPNQFVIFNRQIIEVLNHIFQLDVSDTENNGCTIEDCVNLKGSAIELLEAMLESTDTKTKELVPEIAEGLDIEHLHHLLAQFSEWKDDRDVQRQGFDDEAEQGMFRTYHVLVHLMDYGIPAEKVVPDDTDDDDDPKKQEIVKVWRFCESQSKSVEVFYKNMNGEKILTKVHFPFNPANELRDEVVERVKWNISRDSAEDKLRDFMEWIKAVKRDTIHSTRLHNFLPTRILTAFPLRRHQLLLLWTFLMNLFVIIAFAVPPESVISRFDLDGADNQTTFLRASGAIRPSFLAYWKNSFPYVIYGFGIVHVILSLWMVLEYFVVNWPNFRLPKFYYRLSSRLKKVSPHEETYSDIPIFGLQTLYVVLFLLCSILSIPFYGYFYCLCLLHIIVNNDILQRVLRSITKNGKSLLWVAVLGSIVLFIYSVVSFAFLHESFLAEGNNDGDLFCSTLYECYASVVRYGLIENIGLIVPLVPTEFSVAALRLLYDVSFFIIITTIGLNIVFGIIVDTFSELRDERYRIEEDKKSVCFICSLPSHEFERRASGFDDHVENDHNMWNYIYYSIYLDHIDTSDHNAIEGYVYKMIKEGKIEFFPLFESTVLEKEEDTTAKQLEELKEIVMDVLQHFREEEHNKARQTKQREQQRWEEENFWKDQPSLDAQGSIDASAPPPPAGRTASFSGTRQASFDGAHQPTRRFRETSVGHQPSYL